MTGDELRRTRKRLALTQVALAERIGVDPNTVARWERGERAIAEPTARLIRMLAEPAWRPDVDPRNADWTKQTADIDAGGRTITPAVVKPRSRTKRGARR